MTLPKTNLELQNSKKYREKDSFFYLVRIKKTDGVTHIHIDPNLPVVAINDKLRDKGVLVKEGVFGAHMEVGLINDGPVTIWLDSGN